MKKNLYSGVIFVFLSFVCVQFTVSISIIPNEIFAQEKFNSITFYNQSGEPALVKLIGPSAQSLEVPNSQSRTVNVAVGEYYILIRYGSAPEKYWYAKGEPFSVTQTSTKYSAITITLHKVIGGDYKTESISAEEFEREVKQNGIISENSREGRIKAIEDFRQLQERQEEQKNDKTKKDLNYYFPIQKGNLWEYRLSKPLGGYMSWPYWVSEGSDGSVSEDPSKEIEFETKEIEIEDVILDSPFKKKYKVRELVWPENAIWEISIIKIPTHNTIQWEVLAIVEDKWERRNTFRIIFLWDSDPKRSNYEKIIHQGISYKRYDRYYTISVPAGIFSDCIEIIEETFWENIKLKTYFYYAPHVGLVLLYQTDKTDKLRGYYELLKYQIASKNR